MISFFVDRWPGSLTHFQPKGKAKPACCWCLNSFEAVRGFLIDIREHLRTTRVRKKVEIVLADIDDRAPYSRHPDARQRSEARLNQIRELNRRGRPQIALAYDTGKMPPLLGYAGGSA